MTAAAMGPESPGPVSVAAEAWLSKSVDAGQPDYRVTSTRWTNHAGIRGRNQLAVLTCALGPIVGKVRHRQCYLLGGLVR